MEDREDIKDDIEEEFESRPSVVSRIFRAVVVLAVIGGLVYLSGVYQYFFFQRTPSFIVQEEVETSLDEEQLIVPLTIFILVNSDSNGSRRSQADALHLVEQADRIWEQASIDLEVEAVHVLQMSDEEIALLYNNVSVFVQNVEGFETRTINAFLVGNLQGLNGVAFGGIPAIAVADYTTVYDFRAFAHEVGHKLGLDHVPVDEQRLMYRGANGFDLSVEEVVRARQFAERFR